RGKVIGRPGEMEAHVSEHRDEVEQHAEADAVGGEKLRIFEMPQHLPRRSGEALRANEAFLPRQQQRERVNDKPASVKKAPRQRMRSPSPPGTKRPQNPPRLDPAI